MAFTKKTWTDRVAEYINRRVLNKTDGTQEVVTVERSEGDVSVEGDAFNAANMNDLEDRIEEAIDDLKKSVSNGKSTVASAITTKGVTTASDATFDTMATNIKNIPNANSGTYTPTSRAAALDMGVANTYRYVNTNSVPNTNSATYTPTWNGTHDLGATNDYRYINTNTVYNSGYNSGYNATHGLSVAAWDGGASTISTSGRTYTRWLSAGRWFVVVTGAVCGPSDAGQVNISVSGESVSQLSNKDTSIASVSYGTHAVRNRLYQVTSSGQNVSVTIWNNSTFSTWGRSDQVLWFKIV